MNVQSVTFFPVPPVKPITYPPRQMPAEDSKSASQSAPRALTQSHLGRNVDFKV